MKEQIVLQVYRGLRSLFGGRGLTRVPFLNSLKKNLASLLRSDKVEIDGYTFWLDELDSLNLHLNGTFEPLQTKLTKEIVRIGDVVVDVGAHIGYYTLILARAVGNEGRVYAFEPHPKNFPLLQKNVEFNGYRNVVIVAKAVSSKDGQTNLYLSRTNSGDSRVYEPIRSHGNRDRKFVQVDTVRLDDVLRNEERVDFIKMDIQGAEGLALEGANETIKRNEKIIIIAEFFPDGLDDCGTDPKNLLGLLRSYGFRLYEIGTRRINPIDDENLLRKCRFAPNGMDDFTSLLCTRRPLEEILPSYSKKGKIRYEVVH